MVSYAHFRLSYFYFDTRENTVDKKLERILPRVQKPARYVGGEFNAVMKDKSKVDTRVAFCFPDTYEIGMSNLGMRILYGVMNNMEGVWCERCFAPWGDMEQEMRQANIPLYALESFDPIRDFDIIAFSVGYEMAFPAMVNMLDLAGVPLHASERTALTPLVVAGGTAMYNCEPIADFIDLAFIGEGEEMDVELIELHRQARREGWSKHDFLVRAAQIRGIYVPSLYDVDYNDDGTVESRGTFQGYSDSSAWARGQAWGLYGYTMCYRETGDAKYLKHAERIADFIMHHPNTPADRIPYWDYNAPDIPDAPRDASAAAVVSSALFELSTLVPEADGKRYFDYAETLLMNLSSDAYLARKGANGGFILMHSVGHLPADSEIDTPLNYADYYYLEAIGRYLSLRGLDPRRI